MPIKGYVDEAKIKQTEKCPSCDRQMIILRVQKQGDLLRFVMKCEACKNVRKIITVMVRDRKKTTTRRYPYNFPVPLQNVVQSHVQDGLGRVHDLV